MEFPLEFWFDYAWNPEAYTADNLDNYYSYWAKDVFDGIETEAIADIMRRSTKFTPLNKEIDSITVFERDTNSGMGMPYNPNTTYIYNLANISSEEIP